MTYKQLKRTFDILASHDEDGENGFVSMWAEHDEHGIDYDLSVLSDNEIVELAEIGWFFGSDGEMPDSDELEGVYDSIHNKVLDKERFVYLIRENIQEGLYKYE